jgi:ABC-type uncharacterized transport system permease subunit
VQLRRVFVLEEHILTISAPTQFQKLRDYLRELLPWFALSVLLGSIAVLTVQESPLRVYTLLIREGFFTRRGFMIAIQRGTPLILEAAAATIAFRAGAINMGMAGQVMVGSTFASMAANAFSGLPKLLHLPLCLLAAAIGGAAAAFVPALFKRLSGINEVITGMIANLVMPYLLTLFRSGLRIIGLGRRVSGRQLPETAFFRHFADLTHGAWGSGTKANTAIFMAIAVALFAGWWLQHSKLGFEIRMTKANFSFAEFAGINAGRGFFLGMMLSGAIAGLEAATEVLGVWHGGGAGTINVGEKGLILSLVGAQSFIGSIIAGLALGGLESGTMNVSWFSSVPRPLVDIVVLLVLVLCAVPGMRAFFTSDPSGSEHLGGRYTTTWR